MTPYSKTRLEFLVINNGDPERKRLCSYHLDEGLKQDLNDLKFYSGEKMSQLVRKAIVSLIRERVRHMVPTSKAAERLIAKYRAQKD